MILAGGLQRESFEQAGRDRLYLRSGAASRKAEFRGGIDYDERYVFG